MQTHVLVRLETQKPMQRARRWGRQLRDAEHGRGYKTVSASRVSGTKYPFLAHECCDQFSAQAQDFESSLNNQTGHGEVIL